MWAGDLDFGPHRQANIIPTVRRWQPPSARLFKKIFHCKQEDVFALTLITY